MTDADLIATPVGFACEILQMNLYDWQARALTWFENCMGKRVKGSISTPNGAGKDSIVIAALSLWWVSVHARGRVVITSKDAKQIEEQTEPSIRRHQSKFQGWKFIERKVETPTGGRIMLYTTNDESRAEGFHHETDAEGKPSPDGPLLLIANEAKSLDEALFTAFDRCTYDGLLYASSPGQKAGRFYDSHFKADMGFKTLKVGLQDCPHIPQERIDDILATYGVDSAFARSTLFGEFMDADSEQRFDRDGLNILKQQVESNRTALIGSLEKGSATSTIQFTREDAGWLWLDEAPMIGGEYLFTCDPNTMEQGEGAKDRDNTAGCIIRKAYIDERGVEHSDHVVAALHWPGGVKWDSDVTARRVKLLTEWYGNCMAVIEANNFGSAFMKELQPLGVKLWERTRVDDVNPNKTMKKVGWLTTATTREHWVQACTKALRAQEDDQGRKSIALRCCYKPAVDEFHTFIFTEDGRGEAQAGAHDDWVAAIGIGLTVRCFTKLTAPRPTTVRQFLTTANGQSRGGWE